MHTSFLTVAAGGQVLAASSSDNDFGSIGLLFFLSGFVFYGLMFLRYRNVDKRHMHAQETAASIANVQAVDEFRGRRTRQSNRRLQGANERHVEGAQNSGLAASVLGKAAGGSVQNMLSRFT